jgi:hypothetical protein
MSRLTQPPAVIQRPEWERAMTLLERLDFLAQWQGRRPDQIRQAKLVATIKDLLMGVDEPAKPDPMDEPLGFRLKSVSATQRKGPWQPPR